MRHFLSKKEDMKQSSDSINVRVATLTEPTT